MKKFWSNIKFGIFAICAIVVGIFATSFAFDRLENWAFQNKERVAAETSPQEIGDNSLATTTVVEKKKEEPKYFYFTRDEKVLPKVSARAYIVGDLNTGEIILAKNENERFPIASVSKLMTALVGSELTNPGDTTKVSARALATYGENGGFYTGEKIKVSDLLHPLLLESSNDAAEIIAESFGREIFMRKMNQQAQKLKMGSTNFDDPSGLSNNNRSTVSDLFKLAGHIYQKRPDLLTITKERSHTAGKHIWFSNNQFLNKKNYVGGKSGFTMPAKQTVVSLFNVSLSKNGSRPIGIVLLQSADRRQDVENILSYLNKYVYYGGDPTLAFDWIKERLDIGSLREPDYARLAFLGDMMLDRGVESSVRKNFSGNYSSLFEKLDILEESDVVFANLEGPASDKGEDQRNLYSFRMDPSVIPALKGAGITIVSVSNNHMGDWGRAAFIDTLARLRENEMLYTGGGKKSEAENPTIIERNGITIGFLGFSDVGPQWLSATETVEGTLLANNPRFEEIIRNAATQVDYLVVSFHWGDEYKKVHNERQALLAHSAIDNGARIVVGHHPHVTQDTEIYKNGFIMYSLGNFIFDQKFSKDTMQGAMFEIEVRQDGSMTKKENTIKLNSYFQPDTIIQGKEEVIKF